MNLEKIIQQEKEHGALLDVLKCIQEEEGYISDDAIRAVAKAYGRYPSEIYETATFYSMLSVKKNAKHIIEVCGSTCCHAVESREIFEAVKEELQINIGEITADGKWIFKRCECIGRCDTSPNAVVDGVVYTNVTPESIVEVIRKVV